MSYDKLADALLKVGSENALHVVSGLDSQFKVSGRTLDTPSVCNYATLSRYVLYYSLLCGEKARSEKPKQLRPAWLAMKKRYEEFQREASIGDLLVSGITSDALTSVGYLSTRKRGSQISKLNFSLSMFLLFLREEGELNHEFWENSVPEAEKSFLDGLVSFLDYWLREVQRATDRSIKSGANGVLTHKMVNDLMPATVGSNSGFPSVLLEFAYNEERWVTFKNYQRRYSVHSDNRAHFIIYRPQKNDPLRMSKTFLAISGPIESSSMPNRNSFKFVHVYSPPRSIGAAFRLSLGRVIPLVDAVYLVGGQRIDTKDQEYRPFTALKVIYFPWSLIRQEASFLFGLTLSASSDGTPLVSRIVARATSISDSKQLKLGTISNQFLLDDLTKDIETERQITKNDLGTDSVINPFMDNTDPESISEQCRMILANCNNNPDRSIGWGVDRDFERIDCAESVPSGRLTTNAILGVVEENFGSSDQPKFENKWGEAFDFWETLRFGPLTSE